jgi:hypothetical protein
MSTFEELFNNSVLSVVTPQAALGFPSQDDPNSWEDWIVRLEAESTDRKMAFFGKVYNLTPLRCACPRYLQLAYAYPILL